MIYPRALAPVEFEQVGNYLATKYDLETEFSSASSQRSPQRFGVCLWLDGQDLDGDGEAEGFNESGRDDSIKVMAWVNKARGPFLVSVTDDVRQAAKAGRIKSVNLRIKLSGWADDDEIVVYWNHTQLEGGRWDGRWLMSQPPSALVRQGSNQLSLRLAGRILPADEPSPVIEDIQLWIRYR